jgi:hypothetical protein
VVAERGAGDTSLLPPDYLPQAGFGAEIQRSRNSALVPDDKSLLKGVVIFRLYKDYEKTRQLNLRLFVILIA